MFCELRPGFSGRSTEGRPLFGCIKSVLEPLFRTSFADVRLHIGPQPASLGAKAFVRGNDLYVFGKYFEPHTKSGLRLLAHELAHIQQQREGRTIRHTTHEAGLVDDPVLELEAECIAEDVIRRLERLPRFAPGGGFFEQTPIQVFPAFQLSANSYRIAAGNEGALAGAVLVRKTDSQSVVLNDLEVYPRYRKRGLGRALVSAALATGASLGARNAIVVSGDAGTGHLTNWYERIGFKELGWHLGFPKLVAQIDRVLTGCGVFRPVISGGFVQCMRKKNKAKPMSLADFQASYGPQPSQIWDTLEEEGTIDPKQVYFGQTRAGNRYQDEFTMATRAITTVEEHAVFLQNDRTNLLHESTPPIDIVFYKGQIMCLTGNRRLYVHKKANKPIKYKKLTLNATQISQHPNVDPEAPRANLTIS